MSKWIDLVPPACINPPKGSYGGYEDEAGVYPLDEWNAELLDLCAPLNWENPNGQDIVYDLVAIGAGAGGLVSSKQSARRGWKSALIERHIAGGDCLNTGCVPSKALLSCAKTLWKVRSCQDYGVYASGSNVAQVDFEKVMERMRRLRTRIAPADSYTGAQKLGVDVYQGTARFVGCGKIQVGSQVIRFRKAVIATGARADVPAGVEKIDFLTNSTLFNLTKLPCSMVIIGGGPVSCEMAQAFQMFGTQVTIILRSKRLLSGEDEEASSEIDRVLCSLGVKIFREQELVSAQQHDGSQGNKTITCRCKKTGQVAYYKCEQVLVAAGRRANVDGLDLEKVGVEYSHDGVFVDDYLRTSNPNVFAVGDVVAFGPKFTHVSGTHAQMVVDNALMGGERKVSDLVVPHVTYTWPEVASVGTSESQAQAQGIAVDVYKSSLAHNDRAILEGLDAGFCKIICKKATDEIIGATIVGHSAGELITQINMAMRFSIGLERLGAVIHSYPSFSECVGGCGFAYKLGHWLVRKDYENKQKQMVWFTGAAAAAICCVTVFILKR